MGGVPGLTADPVQSAHSGQPGEFVLAQLRNAPHQVVDAGERTFLPGAQHGQGGLLAQPLHVAQAHADRAHPGLSFHRAAPVRTGHIDGPHLQPVPLGVLDDGGRMVEPHGLVVQQRGNEGRRIVAFQIGARISQQGETGRVRFRETVQGEGGDGLHDAVLSLPRNPVALHSGAQLDLDGFHFRFGALVAEGAAQLFGLASGKTGGDHGHAQQLLLKQGDAQGAFQDRFQGGMEAFGRLAALPPLQVGMHHPAGNGPGPDEPTSTTRS
jgi:hypothetical protein